MRSSEIWISEIWISEIWIIEICNNLQHSLYNSLQDSNDLFDKFAKIITVWSSTNLSLRAKFQEKKEALTKPDVFAR